MSQSPAGHVLVVAVGVAAGHPQPTTNVDVTGGIGTRGLHIATGHIPRVFSTVAVTVGHDKEPPGAPMVVRDRVALLVAVGKVAEVLAGMASREEERWRRRPCSARVVGRTLGGGWVPLAWVFGKRDSRCARGTRAYLRASSAMLRRSILAVRFKVERGESLNRWPAGGVL